MQIFRLSPPDFYVENDITQDTTIESQLTHSAEWRTYASLN